MLIGYARVSTMDQNLDLQTDALTQVGCEIIFHDTLSGATTDRPGLKDTLSHLRRDDTLVVWKLDGSVASFHLGCIWGMISR